ncbi:MAG TPA: efflux RND transporter periplasmic adaptor subunit [Saprospiraceae bacterium]|nr:efflux RND transporter periplasmic adaptor subunit [Saprospiraceae bacterium]HMQ81380.1 efflux RND transporter periplasmic adaptor subunit [Saprospiraceae bacterium]
MKYFIQLVLITALLASCGGNPGVDTAMPEDLEGKKALLQAKKDELRTLTQEVEQLEAEIQAEDPDFGHSARRLVAVIPVQKGGFKHYVDIQGAVKADDFIDVTSETGGRIIKLTVDEGDAVRKGQLIAEVDLEQLQKQKAELEKSMELANSVYERQKRLWDQNIGSEIQYLEAKNNKERLEKSMETLDFQMSKSKIYAPAAGVVDRVVLQLGELASPGMPIVQLLNPSKLKVSVSLPENYLRSVKVGESIDVHFPAINQDQKARISLIGRTIDPANRTFEIEADVSNSSGLLKPNLLAIVKIVDSEIKDAITIPLEMVQQEVSGKQFVFIQADSEKGPVAKKVYIKTGQSYQGNVVIEEGLEGGETLITQGSKGLADNELLEIKQQG